MMKKIFKQGVLIVVLIVGSHCAKAQFTDPDGDPDTPIPLDPGSWVLVAAGVGYGVKKWRDSRLEYKKKDRAATDRLPGDSTTDNSK
jgi:hypothetical protein